MSRSWRMLSLYYAGIVYGLGVAAVAVWTTDGLRAIHPDGVPANSYGIGSIILLTIGFVWKRIAERWS